MCADGVCPTPELYCDPDTGKWTTNAVNASNSIMARGNGFGWDAPTEAVVPRSVVEQLLRQPHATLLFVGLDMYMNTNYSRQNEYMYAWLGSDNFVYVSSIGSEKVTPVYDCNDYANNTRVASAQQARACTNGNCCDPTGDNLSVMQQICNYPSPSEPGKKLNIC